MRLLHTMLRVGDLQRSIDFYTNVIGMKLLRQRDNPSNDYSLAFLGFEANPDQAELELTYNYGVDRYDLGTAYGHIAVQVPNAREACDRIRAAGGNVTRDAGTGQGRHDGDRVRRGPGRLQDRTDRALSGPAT